MAINKSTVFADDDQQLAEWCKALAHPARVAIMNLLLEKKSCVCGDITDQLPLAQSTVSQHLKALKKIGLIKGEIEGTRTCYCINEAIIPTFSTAMSLFVSKCNNFMNQTNYC